MNLLTISVLLVLVVFAIIGYIRGFVKTLTSILLFALTGVLVCAATPYVSDFLKTKTPVYSFLESQCEKVIEAALFDQIEANKEENEHSDQEEKSGDFSLQEQILLIQQLPLPETLKEQLAEHNNSYDYEKLAAETFAEYISKYLAEILLKILTYFVSFVLIGIALYLLTAALHIMTMLPVIHGMNRIFGMLLGLGKGIVIVWLFFLGVTLMMNTTYGTQIMAMIKESPILTFLYDNNLFLKYLLNL